MIPAPGFMPSPRSLYSSSFGSFLSDPEESILGRLIGNYHGEAKTTTVEAWISEIEILKGILPDWREENAQIIFEYDIPRLGKRIDVVLLLRGHIFCLEFKNGKRAIQQPDIEQVMDYALDLKNFHLYSQDRLIIPILIPTEFSSSSKLITPSVYEDQVFNPLVSGKGGLGNLLTRVLDLFPGANTLKGLEDWIISPYSPTPTIVEAARALYENHSVEDITRHESDKESTEATTSFLLKVIDESKRKGHKSICFVTGVPGAGKTLVGLDVAIKQTYMKGSLDRENGAVYLSGNGPLVAVLTEALAKNNQEKCKEKGEKKNLSDSRREVREFIQIIHRYRDSMLAKIKNPVVNGVVEIDPDKAVKLTGSGYGEVEHIAIFDEAQRSWTQKRLSDYLKRGGTYGNKLKVPNFPMSEAEFLIWSLDRREDWAVIICLVGGGQEINTGEAGITEWIRAVNNRFRHWHVYISDKLTAKEYADGEIRKLLISRSYTEFSDKLHLAVSRRSFRAETLSDFVHALLAISPVAANLYSDVLNRGYPVLLTRDMDKARAWLRRKARGSERTGVLVSKVAARFKPLAVTILPQGDENAVHWFLEDVTDVRSSNYLEDAATEIQVQGLELDYACVLWDADMRYSDGQWSFYKFNGKTRWIPERNRDNQEYMLNAYRVLLTRARQGIIICVPKGNSLTGADGFYVDQTRLPEYYDFTYQYLRSLGIQEI